jgi:hypothetical protein
MPKSVENQVPPNLVHSKRPHHVRSTPVVFWGEKSPGQGAMAQNVQSQCQNLNWDSAQAIEEGHFALHYVNHLAKNIWT